MDIKNEKYILKIGNRNFWAIGRSRVGRLGIQV